MNPRFVLVVFERVREVADVRLVLQVVVDRHDIELARQVFEVLRMNEVVRHTGQLPALSGIDRIFRMIGQSGLGLDFDETDHLIPQRDNIEFTDGATEVPSEDSVAVLLEEADGIALRTACKGPAPARHGLSALNAGEFALLFARLGPLKTGLRLA